MRASPSAQAGFSVGKIGYERISEINPGGRYFVADEREILFIGSDDWTVSLPHRSTRQLINRMFLRLLN